MERDLEIAVGISPEDGGGFFDFEVFTFAGSGEHDECYVHI